MTTEYMKKYNKKYYKNSKRYYKKHNKIYICPACATQFKCKHPTQKFCSQECANKNKTNPRRNNNDKIFESWKEEKVSLKSISFKTGLLKRELAGCFKKRIKEFLLEEQNHKCKICGQIDIWNNKTLRLILDHIDGKPFNHIRSNLRLICSNCDTQTDTFGSKNNGNGRSYVVYYRKKWRKKPKRKIIYI